MWLGSFERQTHNSKISPITLCFFFIHLHYMDSHAQHVFFETAWAGACRPLLTPFWLLESKRRSEPQIFVKRLSKWLTQSRDCQFHSKGKLSLLKKLRPALTSWKRLKADEQQIPPTMLSNILKNREKYKKQFYSGDNLLKKRDRACQHGEVDAELLKWFKGLRYVLPEYAHAHTPLPPLNPPPPPPPPLSLSLSLSLWALHDLSSHVPAKNRTAIWCNVYCHTCFYCRFSLWLFAFRLTLSSYRKQLQTIGDWKTNFDTYI